MAENTIVNNDGYIATPDGEAYCRESVLPFTRCNASDGHQHVVLVASRDEILAELVALRRRTPAPVADARREESAWLIERIDCSTPTYWDGRSVCTFSYKPDEDIRFARREDAERVLLWMVDDHAKCRIREHMWVLPDTTERTPAPVADAPSHCASNDCDRMAMHCCAGCATGAPYHNSTCCDAAGQLEHARKSVKARLASLSDKPSEYMAGYRDATQFLLAKFYDELAFEDPALPVPDVERLVEQMVTVVPNTSGDRAELWLAGAYRVTASADVEDVLSAARHIREDIAAFLRAHLSAPVAQEATQEPVAEPSINCGKPRDLYFDDVLQTICCACSDADDDPRDDLLRRLRDIVDVGTNDDLLLEVSRLNEHACPSNDAWIERAAKDATERLRSNGVFGFRPSENADLILAHAERHIAAAIRDAMKGAANG